MLRQYCIHLRYLIYVTAIASPDHELDLRVLLARLQSRMLALRTTMLDSRVPQSSAPLLLLCRCKLFLIFLVREYIVVE